MKLKARRLKLKKITLTKKPETPIQPNPEKTVFAENKKNRGLFQVTPALFMSGYDSACNEVRLKQMGISHVVNLTAHHCANSHIAGVEYSDFRLSDHPEFDLTPQLQNILNIIATKIHEGKRVLVHCKMGISRAPSVVMAFLIKSLGMSYQNALDHILRINSRVCPNLGYLIQLQKL